MNKLHITLSITVWVAVATDAQTYMINDQQGCGKYILIDSTQRYNLAGEGCRKGYNGELVRINSLSQQKYIQNWLNTLPWSVHKQHTFWVGARSSYDDSPEMRWNCGWDSVADGYENWASGEPNLSNGSDRCAFMKRQFWGFWYKWRTNNCEIPTQGKTPLAICHVCECNGSEAGRCCDQN